MQPIFDPMELDLTTTDERAFFENFVRDAIKYQQGKLDGVNIKAQTAIAAAIAKKQQSRSAMAMVKYDREKRGLPSGAKRIEVGKR